MTGPRSQPSRSSPSSPAGRDRGTISIFTAIFTLSVILLAGLLVDGGLAIHARERAYDIAEQAARAGANDIDENSLRSTGNIRIATNTACGKANDLMGAYSGDITSSSCNASPDQVQVTVNIRVSLQLLSIVPGFNAFTMTGTASAHPDEGNP